jgi:chemotaxis protein histidine kinase CheA
MTATQQYPTKTAEIAERVGRNEKALKQRFYNLKLTGFSSNELSFENAKALIESYEQPSEASEQQTATDSATAEQQRQEVQMLLDEKLALEQQRKAAATEAATIEQQRKAAATEAATIEQQRKAAATEAATIEQQRKAAATEAATIEQQRKAAATEAATIEQQRQQAATERARSRNFTEYDFINYVSMLLAIWGFYHKMDGTGLLFVSLPIAFEIRSIRNMKKATRKLAADFAFGVCCVIDILFIPLHYTTFADKLQNQSNLPFEYETCASAIALFIGVLAILALIATRKETRDDANANEAAKATDSASPEAEILRGAIV